MTFIIAEIVFTVYMMIGAYVAYSGVRAGGIPPLTNRREWLFLVLIWPFFLKEIRLRRKDADRLEPFREYLESERAEDEEIAGRLRDVTRNGEDK